MFRYKDLIMPNVLKIMLFFAISLNTYSLEGMIKDYKERILPTYNECKSENYCLLTGEVESSELVVILPGNKEPYLMYLGMALDIQKKAKKNVVLVEQRGQGLNSRPLKNKQKIHVQNFDQYINDIDKLLVKLKKKIRFSKIKFIGHSMGSLIAFEYAKINPSLVSELVLSSPMFKIKAFGLPETLVRNVTSFLSSTPLKESYAFGEGDYKERSFHMTNRSTSSRKWYDFSTFIHREHPELTTGGNTFGWVSGAYVKAHSRLSGVDKLRMKVVMFQATDDEVVDPHEIKKMCELLSDCTLVTLTKAKHDLFREKEIHRKKLFEYIF